MRDSIFRSHTVTTQGMHDLGRILWEESGRKYRKKKYKRHFRINGKCVCVACLSLSWCAHICVCWRACTETWGDRVTLHLFLRWDLSLSLELGWQSANPSAPPDSGPHSAGFTGAMDSHVQLLHRFGFRSSSYKASILTFLYTKQSPWHYQLRNHTYTKYLIFNISSTLFVVIRVWLFKKISIFSWCWHHSV